MGTIYSSGGTPEIATTETYIPEPVDNDSSGTGHADNLEPLEGVKAQEGILQAMGIDDSLGNLPEADAQNLVEVTEYISEIAKSRGLSPTTKSFKKVLDGVKEDMGLDADAEPEIVLDRLGGVIKAWKELTFISNPQEKRKIFMRLAQMKSSEDMNKEIFNLMESRKVWR